MFDGVVAGPGAKVPANTFVTLPGYQVEKLFTVPKGELGSWVSLTSDDKGRLIASDQGGLGLVRITPGKVGTDEETKVEKIPAKISAAPTTSPITVAMCGLGKVSVGIVAIISGAAAEIGKPMKMASARIGNDELPSMMPNGTMSPMAATTIITGFLPKRSESAGTTRLDTTADKPSTLISMPIVVTDTPATLVR